jgi:hypothetical protein
VGVKLFLWAGGVVLCWEGRRVWGVVWLWGCGRCLGVWLDRLFGGLLWLGRWMRWLFGDVRRLLSFDLQSDDAAIEARQGFINDSHQGHSGHDTHQPTPLAPRIDANLEVRRCADVVDYISAWLSRVGS